MPLDAKYLYRRLDALLAGLDPRRSQGRVLETFLEESFRALHGELRLRAGLLYAEERDSFALRKTVGVPGSPVADNLSSSGPPLSLVFQHRTYVFGEPEAEASPSRLGLLPPGASAALIVGRRPKRHVLFFLLEDGWVLEELDFALNTVRAALGSRLSDERVRGSVREAAEIQQSLLVEEPPDFPGFDIACRSVPTEEVGGDFYDFLSFGGEMLGIAIGDASGHGLPAALLVRDVVTGLRMGIEKDLKVAYVFSKLNRVIHRSNLSSRFISVFYGELEADGNLIYVNAGHFPPDPLLQEPGGPPAADGAGHGGDRDRPPSRGPVPPRLRARAPGRGARALHRRDPGAARRQGRVLRHRGPERRGAAEHGPRRHRRSSTACSRPRSPSAKGGPSTTTRPWWW